MKKSTNMKELKKAVFEANLELVKQGLVIYTWGNVSAIDREAGVVVIKPSGVDYDTMKAEDMVVVDLDGNVLEGEMRPSSDLPTHLVMYSEYEDVTSVVHTHSKWATSWAQSGCPIPCYGTTHADYFYGEIPCTRALTEKEISEEYEVNTGRVIVETLNNKSIKPLEIPGIIIFKHGPFSWGKSPEDAVHNAKVMEEVGNMAFLTRVINPDIMPVEKALLDKHYLRKHGANAYYGQK